MADQEITELTEDLVPSLTDLAVIEEDPTGTPTTKSVEAGRLLALQGVIPGGRLTLTSGSPVTNSDVVGATTVYYTSYLSNTIQLYDGNSWKTVSFTEKSIALGTVTSALPYDVFGYLSSGTLALEKLAWTSATARATALTRQDGRVVKSGNATRLYLGTFYTTSTTTTEDSEAKRFLWNMYNRIPRPLNKQETTSSWTTNTGTIRQANASSANKVEIIIGVAYDEIDINVLTSCTGSGYGVVGIGEDTTTAFTTSGYYQGGGGASGIEWFVFSANLRKIPAAGYHYYSWNELTNGVNVTLYGGTGANNFRAGIFGKVMA